eukprot:COSAG02_NODE_258_length_26815_cov_12.034998_12_plen_1650_part_00
MPRAEGNEPLLGSAAGPPDVSEPQPQPEPLAAHASRPASPGGLPAREAEPQAHDVAPASGGIGVSRACSPGLAGDSVQLEASLAAQQRKKLRVSARGPHHAVARRGPRALEENQQHGEDDVPECCDQDFCCCPAREDSGGESDDDDGSRRASQRRTFAEQGRELAREYVDDDSRDRCTSCPPTCGGVVTFVVHMLRALLPFLYLCELTYRFGVRKCVRKCTRKDSCCNRQCVPFCERRCVCTTHDCQCCCFKLETRAENTCGGSVANRAKDHWRYCPCFTVATPHGHTTSPERSHCCKQRFADPETGQKWAQKQKLVTARRMAECLGWLYYMFIVYIVLCRSAHFHYWFTHVTGEAGDSEGVVANLFFGSDPWQEHPDFVDPALSITYYPVCTYLLLVLLHAHEETSYPRRQRIEYSVETGSILALGVKLVQAIAHNPHAKSHDDRRSLARSWPYWREAKSITLSFLGSLFCILSLQVLFLYGFGFGNSGDSNQTGIQWLVELEDADLQHDARAYVPLVVGLILILFATASWIITDLYTQQTGWGTGFCCSADCKIELASDHGSDHRPLPQAPAGPQWWTLGMVPRVFGRGVATLLGLLGIEGVSLALASRSKSAQEVMSADILEFGLAVPVLAMMGLGAGWMMVNVANSDLRRKNGWRQKRFGKNILRGDRVEIGACGVEDMYKYDGLIGTVVGTCSDSQPMVQPPDTPRGSLATPGRQVIFPSNIPECTCDGTCGGCGGYKNNSDRSKTFKVPDEHCVVSLDLTSANDLRGFVESTNLPTKVVVFKLKHISDVDWATGFSDIFADITGSELRKLSFDSEKYSERYRRRFGELQCTPIVNYHYQAFDKSSLEQLKEKYLHWAHKVDREDGSAIPTNALTAFPAAKQKIVELVDEILPFAGANPTADRLSTETYRLTSMAPDDRKANLMSWTSEQLLSKASLEPDRLRDILMDHIAGGCDITSGPFFQFFKNTLIFETRSDGFLKQLLAGCCCTDDCATATAAAFSGAVTGASVGATMGVLYWSGEDGSGFNGKFWLGAGLGGFVGAIVGALQADKDPTANHLAGHIIRLQQDTSEATRSDPLAHTPKPLYADKVGKMILYLSKARQYKRRVQWRSRLWYISVAHAAIPFVYTFILTKPEFSMYVAAYLTIGSLIYALISSSKENRQQKGKRQLSITSWCEGAFVWVFGGVAMLFLILGLPGARSAIGLSRLPSPRLQKDVCAKVLDTQGQCCCNNNQTLVDTIRHHNLKCTASAFAPETGQLLLTAYGHSVWLNMRQFEEPEICAKKLAMWNSANLPDKDYYSTGSDAKADDKDLLHKGAGHICSLPCGKDTEEYSRCRRTMDSTNMHNGCRDGDRDEKGKKAGGKPLNATTQFCTYWCHEGYCGDGPEYNNSQGGIDCSGCRQYASYSEPERGKEMCRPDTARHNCSFLESQLEEFHHSCAPKAENMKICVDQLWLDEIEWRDDKQSAINEQITNALKRNSISQKTSFTQPTIQRWCSAMPDTAGCKYQVAKDSDSQCQIQLGIPLFNFTAAEGLGCLACGGKVTGHIVTFFANVVLTFAIVSRLYRCYEDYYVQYHRMLYFIQLTPWSTMKHVYKDAKSGDVRLKQEHWGLLPTWDLDNVPNIVAWNKLRLFLQVRLDDSFNQCTY